MDRPYVICHMTTSIDGKVTGNFLKSPECANAVEIYYEINRDYHADAYACGRVTMEESFTGGEKITFTDSNIAFSDGNGNKDYIATKKAKFFAVSFDRNGIVGWRRSEISDEDPGYDKAHIIEVLSEKASPEYLSYLRKTGISYIFAGKNDIDINTALKKLYSYFNIKTLLLEGGSIINGAFLRAEVIDELSLVVAPIIAETADKPLFYNSSIQNFSIKEITQYPGGVIRLNYIKNREE